MMAPGFPQILNGRSGWTCNGVSITRACYLCNIGPKTEGWGRLEHLLYVACAATFGKGDDATEGGTQGRSVLSSSLARRGYVRTRSG